MEISLCGVFGDHCVRNGGYGLTRDPTLNCSYRFSAEDEDPDSKSKNFAAEHEAFLDALLHEQQKLASKRTEGKTESNWLHSSCNSFQSNSSWTLSPSSSHSTIMLSENSSNTRKRHRPVRLRCKATRSPVRVRETSASSHPANQKLGRSNTINLNTLGATQPPTYFVHPQCRMQKDKGKGDEIGSSICAKGDESCLEKLRSKMRLLTEHCLEEGSSAKMKRRPAIVIAEYENYTETRSLLSLRMGFLSMTYGILLRWDKGQTEKITLVVLRKNCHESFYQIPPLRGSLSSSISTLSDCPPKVSPSSSMNTEEALEIGMLEPPYQIPRPDVFEPTELSVSVLCATGLDPKSHWTVQLHLGDVTENVLLSHDEQTNLMAPKLGDALTYSYENLNQDLGVLEIKVLEHNTRRKQRVLRCSMRVPCSSLEAQSNEAPTPITMRIPCPDGACIQIAALLISDEAMWQQREIKARSVKARKKSKTIISSSTSQVCEEEDDVSSPWDWICCGGIC